MLVSPSVQVAFNLKKGSLPVRGDIDMSTANDCMQKGLQILADGKVMRSINEQLNPDTVAQIDELFVQFFNDMSMSADDAQERFASLIEDDE